jgi:uncharacterized protein (DUF433 family)
MKNGSRHAHVDLREVPSYTLPEASHYLRIPEATLRSWFLGRHYPTSGGKRFFRPPFDPAERKPLTLSFMNLLEAHVLDAIRSGHGVPLDNVRKALAHIWQTFPSPHPLADHRFETDGVSLFVERYGRLVDVSEAGQTAMRKVLEQHLSRIERDRNKAPLRLNLLTRKRDSNEPEVVVIDPAVSFGRPVLKGTGIPTAVIAERYKAGESVKELAEDYGRKSLEIEEALRCELPLAAA